MKVYSNIQELWTLSWYVQYIYLTFLKPFYSRGTINFVYLQPPPNETPRQKKKVRQSRVQAATLYYSKSLKTKSKLSKFRLGNLMQDANIKAVQLRLLEEAAEKQNAPYQLPFPVVRYPDPAVSSSSDRSQHPYVPASCW